MAAPEDLNSPAPIHIPKEPGLDANGAMDRLFELFPDHYPFLMSETHSEWTFGLAWPNDPLWFVDPSLPGQAARIFGLSLPELATFTQIRQCAAATFIFSMFHSRALLAPAYAAQRDRAIRFSSIVHIDDHDDLMAPLLTTDAGQLHNSITGRALDLNDPISVSEAIDYGAVNKGSFLAAYVLGKPPGSLVHVGHKLQVGRVWLTPSIVSETLGRQHFSISALDANDSPVPGIWSLTETPHLPTGQIDDGAGAVWLDVDLDAFCNRYDGDSYRRELLATAHERQQMHQRISQFLESLSGSEWRKRIKAVSIAASPAFFPSEYWDDAIPSVCNGVMDILNRLAP
jgi:hypothetical protein